MTTSPAPGTPVPFDDLQAHLTGSVLLPDAAGFAERATPYNLAIASRPAAVIDVENPADVAATVRSAAEHGLKVAVRGTGHGVAEFTDPTLLVHTGRLQEVTIRPDGSARIGAGVRWQQVVEAAAPHGLTALCGTAPNVGVVGYLTGGGNGPLARTFGLSSDLVTAFDVVTGDGTIRRASASENPDLFWGLRGGKGALGIVTAVEMALIPATHFLGGCIYVDAADSPAAAHAWREWVQGLDERATSSLAFMRLPPMPGVPEPLAGKVTLAIRFAWTGDPDEGRAVFKPMMASGRVVLGGIDVMPYTAVGAIHSDPVDPMPTREAHTVLHDLRAEAIDTLLTLAGPDAACPQIVVELRHLGGAMARESGTPDAYSHRGAAYSLFAVGIAAPPVVAATTEHGEALLAAFEPWSSGTCLPNFDAYTDPENVRRKYDSETLQRLATLADTYDPSRVIAAADPIRAACNENVGPT